MLGNLYSKAILEVWRKIAIIQYKFFFSPNLPHIYFFKNQNNTNVMFTHHGCYEAHSGFHFFLVPQNDIKLTRHTLSREGLLSLDTTDIIDLPDNSLLLQEAIVCMIGYLGKISSSAYQMPKTFSSV